MATSLVEAIRQRQSIPFISAVDDRRYAIVETVADAGAVRMRLRLSGNINQASSNIFHVHAMPTVLTKRPGF